MIAKAKLATKPRKSPSQERSRATVDAIMQASTYILNEVGWGGLNTNAIAERAGVNIASLYQFFPNKQAVIAELQRRHVTSIRADIQHALQNISNQPTLRVALTVIVEMVVKEHQSAPEVHKAISEELPLSQRCKQYDQGEMLKEMVNALLPFMKNVPDPQLATYMVGISIKAIVHQVTNQRPELLNHSSLVDELVTLMERFLIRE
ncbi:TetR/AcrR family transcriptional regulator [Methylotenera sp.]|uniref:TetR/AcrR family transcriptional regulator n=1 Tax=Methylotenera sp. TaxID=2051956 RepID=UPI0024872FCD|nr:TetR/AcrR family transcriptional regulator [Methylotenera sp.]MDI1361523.1 TetR/AcrR family transcriptional regulator [Methylotenera sp.]